MNLCAERVAALNMYINSGQTLIKRLIAFRGNPSKGRGGMPCDVCCEFFMKLFLKNKDIEIMIDYDSRKTITLKELLPNWQEMKRYEVTE